LGLPNELFPSGVPTKPCMHLSSTSTFYMPPPPHSWFDHSNNIWWAVQIIQLLVMLYPPLPFYLIPLKPKYFPQHPILETLSLRSSSFTPTPKSNCKNQIGLVRIVRAYGESDVQLHAFFTLAVDWRELLASNSNPGAH
jgi:hypothetical protein